MIVVLQPMQRDPPERKLHYEESAREDEDDVEEGQQDQQLVEEVRL